MLVRTSSIGKSLKNSWPLVLITLLVFLFLYKLFIPHLSLILTPDIGRSDSWHLSLSNMYYYWQSLQKNRIPLWNDKIGTGFPTLGEGQTGLFFLPNLFLFRFLPFVWAYNLSIVFALLTAAYGMYFLVRSLGLSKTLSFFAAIIFSLGGFFMVHLQHHNLIQTASLTPWLFWATNEFIKNRKTIYGLALSIFLAAQLFAGFPQIVFYTLIFLTIYAVLNTFGQKNFFKILLFWSFFILIGFTLAAMQLLPTYELLKVSIRENNPQSILTEFPYKFTNLVQIINPFILGNPKFGTYPQWESGKWGIFWENTAYIGFLPLILALGTTVGNFFNFKNKRVFIWVFFAAISILLALGRYSPFQPVYSFAPFSTFRVPSRFLLIFQMSLAVLASFFLERIKTKKIVITVIVLISIIDLFTVLENYNLIGNSKKWLTPPPVVSFLNGNLQSRVFSVGQTIPWNNNLLNKGWYNSSEYLFFARNSLDQNSNLLFGVNQLEEYESLPTQRYTLSVYNLIKKPVLIENEHFTIDTHVLNLLSAENVKYIISPFKTQNQQLRDVYGINDTKGNHFYVYENEASRRYYMVNKTNQETTIAGLIKALNKPDFDPTKEIVLEKEPNKTNLKSWNIQLLNSQAEELTFKTFQKGGGYFVLSDSFYPGWKAYVDGRPTDILAANINSKAVYLTTGNHTVVFKFDPESFKLGLLITLISTASLILIYLKLKTI